ncbi:MAG TPA: hypothetical protein VKS79_12100 [Gemmataceae bacterium]|nr:hypothetical protein [Gemmataceae bacterium]
MLRNALGSTAFFMLAFAAGAWAQEKFEKLTSTDGRYTVEMPGKPTQTSNKSGGGLELHYAIVKSVIEQYQVIYVDFADSVIRGKDPQALLKAYRDGEYAKKKFENEKEINFGSNKYPGTEYRVETVFETKDGGKVPVFIRERDLLVGNRLYVVQYRAVVNKNLLDSKEANKFFDSFELTK